MTGPADYAAMLDSAGPSGDGVTPPPLERIVESLLFTADGALTFDKASSAIRDLAPDQFAATVSGLARTYRRQNRPYAVTPSEGGFALTLKPGYHGLRDRLKGGPREARLSTAALDVLALVAYKQPLSRSQLESLRGHESQNLIRQLIRLGLITLVPQDGARSQPTYATTGRFLDLFGLRQLDDLPQVMDFHSP